MTPINVPAGLVPAKNRIVVDWLDDAIGLTNKVHFYEVDNNDVDVNFLLYKEIENFLAYGRFDAREFVESVLRCSDVNLTDTEPQFLPEHLKYFKVIAENPDQISGPEDICEFSAFYAKRYLSPVNQAFGNTLFVAADTKYIRKSAHYFVTVVATEGQTVGYEVFFDDGTSQTFTKAMPAPGTKDNTKSWAYLLPVGFPQVSYDNLQPGKTITQIEVLSGGTKATLIVDSSSKRYEHELLYWADSGNLETLVATGVKRRQIKTKRTEYNRPAYKYSSNYLDSTLISGRVQLDYEYRVRTGYFRSREEYEAALQILSAEKVFAKLEDQYVEVMVTDKSLAEVEEDETLYSFEFNYKFTER
ncbi:hypothetical protein V6R21_06335 [Limibacter armeniacum]|uniref:hypothetical protein n=1 Tax=Limibacter armeniacum TaxID=466084 RepID=UPI002FE5A846